MCPHQEFAAHTYSELFEIEAARGLPKSKRGLDKQVQVATSYRAPPDTVFFGDDAFSGCFQLPKPEALVLAPLAATDATDGDDDESSDSSGSDSGSDDDGAGEGGEDSDSSV